MPVSAKEQPASGVGDTTNLDKSPHMRHKATFLWPCLTNTNIYRLGKQNKWWEYERGLFSTVINDLEGCWGVRTFSTWDQVRDSCRILAGPEMIVHVRRESGSRWLEHRESGQSSGSKLSVKTMLQSCNVQSWRTIKPPSFSMPVSLSFSFTICIHTALPEEKWQRVSGCHC